jgi:hypothetical protein
LREMRYFYDKNKLTTMGLLPSISIKAGTTMGLLPSISIKAGTTMGLLPSISINNMTENLLGLQQR